MKISQILTEDKMSYMEAFPLLRELEKLYRKNKSDITLDDANQAQKIAKQVGRRRNTYWHNEPWRGFTVGDAVDRIVSVAQQNEKDSGRLPTFTGAAPTLAALAKQIALHTNGSVERTRGLVWTSGRSGQRYKDPDTFIVYNTEDAFNDALEWVKSKGKRVNYTDSTENLRTAYKIGSAIVQPATIVRGPFSGNPQTTYRLSLQSSRVIGSGMRKAVELTDQQVAALQDIAATRDDQAIKQIQAMLDLMKGEDELKRIIDNSKKITARDKQKLDAIIDAAVKSSNGNDA